MNYLQFIGFIIHFIIRYVAIVREEIVKKKELSVHRNTKSMGLDKKCVLFIDYEEKRTDKK